MNSENTGSTLCLENVRFAYPGGDEIVHGVSLCAARGDLVLLAGANGSGKSTLLTLMAGIFPPSSGTLQACGGFARERARLVMQDADLQMLGATVREDLMLGRESGAESAARNMAERLNLTAYWDAPVQTLSWGMKRKVCLGAALLDAPTLLLLDEPFSGLDFPATKEMRAFLAGCKAEGMVTVVAVHDLEPVADLADCLHVLEEGRLVLSGAPEAVLDSVASHGVRPPCSWMLHRTLTPWEHV